MIQTQLSFTVIRLEITLRSRFKRKTPLAIILVENWIKT